MNWLLGGVIIGVVALLSLGKKKRKSSSDDRPPVVDTPSVDITDDYQFDPEVITLPTEPTGLPTIIPSPFGGTATDEQWTRFVMKSRWGNKDSKTSNNNYGWFLLSPQDLSDVGVMTNPRKVGRVWEADWIPPMTLDQFLASGTAQYDAFQKLTARDLKVIRSHPQLMKEIGAKLPNTDIPVTLSGLLGVAHQIGIGAITRLNATLQRYVLDRTIDDEEMKFVREIGESLKRTNGAF